MVVGKRLGPPLWKVSSKSCVLWIFGTLTPLPKSLEWDSSSVEWLISQSEEFIDPPASALKLW